MLVKMTPVVNFTNILRAGFCANILLPKIANPNCKHIKAGKVINLEYENLECLISNLVWVCVEVGCGLGGLVVLVGCVCVGWVWGGVGVMIRALRYVIIV